MSTTTTTADDPLLFDENGVPIQPYNIQHKLALIKQMVSEMGNNFLTAYKNFEELTEKLQIALHKSSPFASLLSSNYEFATIVEKGPAINSPLFPAFIVNIGLVSKETLDINSFDEMKQPLETLIAYLETCRRNTSATQDFSPIVPIYFHEIFVYHAKKATINRALTYEQLTDIARRGFQTMFTALQKMDTIFFRMVIFISKKYDDNIRIRFIKEEPLFFKKRLVALSYIPLINKEANITAQHRIFLQNLQIHLSRFFELIGKMVEVIGKNAFKKLKMMNSEIPMIVTLVLNQIFQKQLNKDNLFTIENLYKQGSSAEWTALNIYLPSRNYQYSLKAITPSLPLSNRNVAPTAPAATATSTAKSSLKSRSSTTTTTTTKLKGKEKSQPHWKRNSSRVRRKRSL